MIDALSAVLLWWLYTHNIVRAFGLALMPYLQKVGMKIYALEIIVMIPTLYMAFQLADILFSYVVFVPGDIVVILGSSLLLTGVGLWMWSIKVLGIMVTVGSKDIKNERTELITNGPYSIMRHPIYFGEWMIGLGIFMMTGYAVFLLFLIFWPFLVSVIIYLEEKLLKGRFGKSYIKYMENVPALFPKIPK